MMDNQYEKHYGRDELGPGAVVVIENGVLSEVQLVDVRRSSVGKANQTNKQKRCSARLQALEKCHVDFYQSFQ